METNEADSNGVTHIPGKKKGNKVKPKGGAKDEAGPGPEALKAKVLAQRAADGDEDAQKALVKIVTCFEKWKQALAKQREVNRKAKEIEGGAEAAFENAIEEGRSATLDQGAQKDEAWDKLLRVEGLWMERKDAIAEADELRKAAAEEVKKRGGELERAAQDGAQLSIPGT